MNKSPNKLINKYCYIFQILCALSESAVFVGAGK